MQIWDIITIIEGLLFSSLGGFIANYIILDCWLWKCQEKHSEDRLKEIRKNIKGGERLKKIEEDYAITGANTQRTIVRVLGFCERILYTIAIIMKFPYWIAIWLTLKTAVRYKGWEDDIFRRYNIFLVGNAISVLFGVMGAYFISHPGIYLFYFIFVLIIILFWLFLIRKHLFSWTIKMLKEKWGT